MYDVIIIGAGFAGYSAAIYSSRYNMKTLVIGSEPGGAITGSMEVCNYPGFAKISGVELMMKMEEQAKGVGADIIMDEVLKLSKSEKGFIVSTRNEKDYEAKALILASGTKRRKLDIKGALEFEGKGIHYCATCDGAFYKNKDVAVIGGSNSAAHAAQLLSKFAKNVYIIYRGEPLRCEPVLLDAIKKTSNIMLAYNANPLEVKGSKFVEKVILDKPFNGSNELIVDGIFVEIGGVPSSAFAKELGLEMTQSGEIITNQICETNTKGVFAAGDVTNSVLRQGIVAASQGAIAATGAYRFVTGKKELSW